MLRRRRPVTACRSEASTGLVHGERPVLRSDYSVVRGRDRWLPPRLSSCRSVPGAARRPMGARSHSEGSPDAGRAAHQDTEQGATSEDQQDHDFPRGSGSRARLRASDDSMVRRRPGDHRRRCTTSRVTGIRACCQPGRASERLDGVPGAPAPGSQRVDCCSSSSAATVPASLGRITLVTAGARLTSTGARAGASAAL